MGTHLSRRSLLRAGAGGVAAAGPLAVLSSQSFPSEARAALAPVDQSTVRLLTVGAALTGGLVQRLVADFAEESGLEVIVSPGGIDIFDRARESEADLVLAHWGFTELEDFVSDGFGRWPATILSNSVAFIVPPADPAGIREVDDLFEAFQRIADNRSPFVINDLGETLYITDTLWNATGRPDPGEWFLDLGLSAAAAVLEAERRGGYTLWGLHPFLMLRQQRPELDVEPVIFNDSLMQRIIASVVAKRPPGRVNEQGALALQRFLVDPATQAQIRSFRLPGISKPVFWPAGNQNDN